MIRFPSGIRRSAAYCYFSYSVRTRLKAVCRVASGLRCCPQQAAEGNGEAWRGSQQAAKSQSDLFMFFIDTSSISRFSRVHLAPVFDTQAQQEHDEAQEVFDFMNKQLIEELPQLLELRVPFFDPSFEAMIRMQCKFAEEGYEKLGGVQRYVRVSLLAL